MASQQRKHGPDEGFATIGPMETNASGPIRFMTSGLPLTVALLAVVLAINTLALWSLFNARSNARQAAEAELVRETEGHARTLEAMLASLGNELAAFAASNAIAGYPAAAEDPDPRVRRWSRLDAESALLLFLESNPAVERLSLGDGAGELLASAGRRQGAPILLPRARVLPAAAGAVAAGRFVVGATGGELEAWLDEAALSSAVAPGLDERLWLVFEGRAQPNLPRQRLRAEARFRVGSWQPPLDGVLLRAEEASGLLASVEDLAGKYRTATLLNLAVMSLSLLLSLLAFRQARRGALHAAAHRYEAELRELERRLYHSERLSSLGRLAAGLAHEINNPLEGMTNYLALLRDDLARGQTADAARHLERLRDGLERAAGTVRQVLTFAAPGRSIEASLDLARVLRETMDFVRGNPAFSQVRLEITARAEPVFVEGERVTLGQLFLNLLLNACEIQPGGGSVEVTIEPGENSVTVRVADRGPGIAPEVAGRLFEPFVSTRGSTGLGLAVCHGIAAAHGGSIDGANRPGGGALFTVRLPLRRASAPVEDPPL